MPRAETSRQNLEKARARLREILSEHKGDKDGSDDVYHADDAHEEDPAPKGRANKPKSKKAAAAQPPPSDGEEESGSDSGSDSESDQEAKPVAKKSRKNEAPQAGTKKVDRSMKRKQRSEEFGEMIRSELSKHMEGVKREVKGTVSSANSELALNRVQLLR